MHTKTELLELLQAHDIRLTKRLGQSYLVAPQTAARLVELCRFNATDRVVEIGAGLGALTVPLAQAVREVVALEVDERVAEVLRERVASSPNIEVQCQDVLTVDWARYAGWNVAGMIPYHITSPILVALSEVKKLEGIWLGVQREVAQRLAASPGTKAYGRLTVLAQYRWDVSVLTTISRHQFFPVPKVDSCWISLQPRTAPVPVDDEPLFFAVVKAAFSQRRKTLANGLCELETPRLTRTQVVEMLTQLGLPPLIRGEQLSIEQFVHLSNAIACR